MKNKQKYTGLEIAIIGIACRFPEANDWKSYWNNLVNGTESIRFFSKEELLKRGMDEKITGKPNFVNAGAVLQNKDLFDSGFFDYRSIEANLMNPTHRIFHECVWEALEDAGYDSEQYNGSIGIYAGAGDDFNWKMYSKIKNYNQEIDDLTLTYLTYKDFLTNLLSYKLNLKGPSLTVNTLCSTSLVAVSLACQGLLLGECKIALAGGVSLTTNLSRGYLYEEGIILSSDGHCRAFDKDSSGTAAGEGAGVIVLKRLKDAIADRDNIHAIIKSSVINNDGKEKVGFSAPSVNGQVKCIKKAQLIAGIEPESISYIECHGTGTSLGDTIELEALNIAFKRNKNHTCAIGSVKTNIGHLDAASGIAGLIKVALSLKFKKIPPSLHYKAPNPNLDFEGGPFNVNVQLKSWERIDDAPLIAGVSSFGIGGTNAHVILEEPPEQEYANASKGYKLLAVSAKTKASLLRYVEKLKNFILQEPSINLADMSYTLLVGRKHFTYRKIITYKDPADLITLLKTGSFNESIITSQEGTKIIFLFPGQGSQYVNMGKDIYDHDLYFKDIIDNGFTILKKLTGEEYKDILYPIFENGDKINLTQYTQPVLFLFEYALSKLIISYGVEPQYMIGHSLGEYVAACISGVFDFEDALSLVTKRAFLMSTVDRGMMISVSIGELEAKPYLSDVISLAAVNSPEQVVLSGDESSITKLMSVFDQSGISYIKLKTSHAFHSSMQISILESYREELKKITFNKPKYPFISNVTGLMITDNQAGSIEYWISHLYKTVLFADGIKNLISDNGNGIYLEIGPGDSLSKLAKQQSGTIDTITVVRNFKNKCSDHFHLTKSIGELWAKGIPVNWNQYYKNEKRTRISLPTYAFEPLKFVAEVDPLSAFSKLGAINLNRKNIDIKDWFYRAQWKQSPWETGKSRDFFDKSILIFADDFGLADKIISQFSRVTLDYYVITIGECYKKIDKNSYEINPELEKDFELLFLDLSANQIRPFFIFHFWNFKSEILKDPQYVLDNNHYQKIGYESLLKIVKNFDSVFDNSHLEIDVVSNGWYRILGNETMYPIKGTSLAAVKVIPLEFDNILCRAIEITDTLEESVQALFKELNLLTNSIETGIRGVNKFIKDFEKIEFEIPENDFPLKLNGTYLITGATGGLGKLFCDFMADRYGANLILVSRNGPAEDFISGLEDKGATVQYIQADVSDYNSLSEGIAKAEERFGRINGIIHTAGIGDFSGIILRRNLIDDNKIFSPKVKGTQVLYSIFKGKDLDFFVNCSSRSASLAPIGQVAYSAANIFQDAMAESGTSDFPIISIEWPAIKEVGMAVNAVKHFSIEEQVNLLKNGITPSEAIKVFLSALYLRLPVPIISTSDLREDFSSHYNRQDKEEDNDENNAGYIQSQNIDRNLLKTIYTPPDTETQKKILKVIETFFGVENIGIDDDFFALGGDSLKAMVFIKRINKEFKLELSLKLFFLDPTVKHIAFCIDEMNSLKTRDHENTHTIII